MKKRTSLKKKSSLRWPILTALSGVAGIVIAVSSIYNVQSFFVKADNTETAAVKGEYATDRVIVKFKNNVSESSKISTLSENDSKRKKKIDRINTEVVEVTKGENVKEVVTELRKDPDVAYAEPDYIGHATEVPNDPGFNTYQWDLKKVSLPQAWDFSHGATNVIIGMVDSGVDATHPDLAGKIVASANFTDEPTADDVMGHGTATSGTAASVTNNGIGFAGAGYNSRFLNAKVLNGKNIAYTSWVANGIIWSADNGAKVINLSLGYMEPSQTLRDAIDYAWNKGAVIVASAGNNANTAPVYPAYYSDRVISVAATDENDLKTDFSTYGTWVHIAAPGVRIAAPCKNNCYSASAYGTSFSAPIVSGIASLMWAAKPTATNLQIGNAILLTADKINGTGTYWKYGRVNALSAVNSIRSIANPTPTPTRVPTATPRPTITPTPTKTPTPTPLATNTPAPTAILPTGIPTATSAPTSNGLLGTYYDNNTFSGKVVSRIDPGISFNWGTGAPISGIGSDTFSVRWTGYVQPSYSQRYTFYARANDGVRVWINNTQIINRWTNLNGSEVSGSISLTAGAKYPIRVEYYDNTSTALIELRWSSTSQAKQLIPTTRYFR